MSFDVKSSERRLRAQRATAKLRRRDRRALPFAEEPVIAGPELLLDTCVYIDVLQGRTPPAVDAILSSRITNHTAVCLAELTHSLGRLDPVHPDTASVLLRIREAIEQIPARRLTSPSVRAMGDAGILAGLTARMSPRGEDDYARLNDCLVFMQAVEQGQTVLTRNLVDFDVLNQLLPTGRVLFYDRTGSSG